MAKELETTNTDVIERVAKLEERVDNGLTYINKDLCEIKNNHLHTLQCDVNDLKIQVNTITVKISVAVAIVTIVIDVALRFILK